MRFEMFPACFALTIVVACTTLALSASAQTESVSVKPPVTVEHPVVFETPFKLGSRPTLRTQSAARAEAISIKRWNVGGRNGSWHPEPRVIVDNVKVKSRSRRKSSVRRTARAKGYWNIRKCYDPALADNRDLRGKMTLRFTLRKSGTVVRPVLVGRPTLRDANVVKCIRRSMRKIKFPRTRRGDARVQLDIALSPGDAPMKAKENPPVTPGRGSVDSAIAQALAARHAGKKIQACYTAAVRRVPGLWGRLLLRADVASNGTIRELVEVDSTFPDQQTTVCAIKALKRIGLPPPKGGEVRMIFPIRLGNPP